MSSLEWITPSGSLGTVVEGNSFSFFLAFDMVPFGNLILTSGSLPEGLVFDPINASISGTVGLIDETTTYPLTFRLQNELGIKDRSFSITVTNLTPTWITSNEIIQDNGQPYRPKMLIDKQLEIFNPKNGSEEIYELISGNLPEELILRKDGRLVGFIPTAGSYFFTVKVVGIIKTFHLTVIDDGQNRPPFWSTINGFIGAANSGTEFLFNFKGADADLDTLEFSLHPNDSLPNGLFFANSSIVGNIAPSEIGNKFFRIVISDGNVSIIRQFYIKANLGNLTDINFGIAVSPHLSYDGNTKLLQDEPSYFKVSAFQQFGAWIRYELSSGSLPSGMTIDVTNGNIVGLSAVTGTYSFTVKAFNDLDFETQQNFTIHINPRPDYFPNKVCAIVTGYERKKLNELYISDRIPYNMIYRAGDRNFGTTLSNEVLIHKYVSATRNTIYGILENRIGSEAIPIKFKHVPVQNSLGQAICECVLLVFKDETRNGLESFISNGTNVQITSLDLLREKLTDSLAAPLVSFANWQSEYYMPIIARDAFHIPNHDMYTGKVVYLVNQDVPSPFLNNNLYYAIVVDKNNIRLANSKTEAQSGNYIQFNVNEVSRRGILHTPHTAIPFVYCNTGFGERVANSLNNLSLSDIKLFFKHFVYGPTSPTNQEELELVWFEQQRI
jgi:hypothetical protein